MQVADVRESPGNDRRRALEVRCGYLFGRVILVATLVESGRFELARKELGVIFALDPEFSSSRLDAYVFEDPGHRDRLLNGLRAAGLPP